MHTYMLSAAGCWARYCSLEDWKAGLAGEQAIDIIQDLVDSYASQHATNRDRRNRQSVAVHLMSLCAGLEWTLSGRQRRGRIGLLAGQDYPMLEPPPASYRITVSDVVAAPEKTRAPMIEGLAASTWSAWAYHHDTIRSWLNT
jgi:hypothetical protein